ncbi:MAG: mechanosensitive ion channel family protein [Anaerolineaceae bacterium]|nr:mechanosensitive ion channel family protein [Anaerolineaceae bacterium]
MQIHAIQDFFKLSFLGITLDDWAYTLLAFLGVLVLLTAARQVFLNRLSKSARVTQSPTGSLILDLLQNIHPYFVFAVAIYAGSFFLNLEISIASLVRILVITLVLLQAGVWGGRLIAIITTRTIATRQMTDRDNTAAINLMGLLARVILWIMVLLLILGNIPNFNVSTLVASLGVTGIAVAFALQRILGDLFASFSIALDKPFTVGDYIVVGDNQGTVENIGLKSTRIRSLSGEQIIISNSDLLASRIQNFKRMQERRIAFSLKISVKTPYEKLVGIPELLKGIIEAQPLVRFGRAHFSEIGDNFLKYEIVYYLLSPEYSIYMDAQEGINLEIMQVFDKEQVQLAFQ